MEKEDFKEFFIKLESVVCDNNSVDCWSVRKEEDDGDKIERLRHQMSALLMNTDESHPTDCYIQIGESESFGLNSLELPVISGVFQQPSEGTIWFQLYGAEEPIEFDDLSYEDLKNIYEELHNNYK